MTDRPVLQLGFIWQAKENTSSRHEGWPTQKKRREENPVAQFCLLFLSGFFFFFFFLFPLSPPYVNWASQEGCLLHRRFFPLFFTFVPQTFLCSIFAGFFLSLSLSHHYFGLLFSYSSYLTFPNPQPALAGRFFTTIITWEALVYASVSQSVQSLSHVQFFVTP